MYAVVNNNTDDADDDQDANGIGIRNMVTTKKKGLDSHHHDHEEDLLDDDALPKLSIRQRKMRGASSTSTSSNWSVETNQEYDKILKELAADAGSSDEDSDDDDDDESSDDDDDDDGDSTGDHNGTKARMKQGKKYTKIASASAAVVEQQQQPMGGDKVDHPIQMSSQMNDSVGLQQQQQRGEVGDSISPTTNNAQKQSSDSSIVVDEEEDDESQIMMDTNSGIRKRGKSTRLQLNRRASLTRILTELAGKAQSIARSESLTDSNSKAAVEAIEKMAAVASSSLSSSLANAHEYHPPTVPENNVDSSASSSSQVNTEQEQQPFHRKGSLDSNCYYLPTKANDGKSRKLPTLSRLAPKGTSNRRSTVESESMWTKNSSDENSSGNKSYWLQSNATNDGDAHDRGGFNESQLTLDSEIMQHHAIDEESLQDVLNDIIRGRTRRREGTTLDGEGKTDDEDESPFHFERKENQFYRPGQQTLHRCIGILFVMAVTIVSAALIGVSVKKKHGPPPQQQNSNSNALTTTGNTTMDETISTIIASMPHGQYTQSDLYYMAKSVNDNCHADQFITAAGRWECQHICHAHYCCFDFDDEDSDYNCRDDVNKLCPIFMGCEILVSHDFVGSGSYSLDGLVDSENSSEEEQPQDSGGTSSTNAQDIIKENELGWQEVRRKYINAHCDESNVNTDTGKEQCEKACKHHYCCFDTGGGCCVKDPSMTCNVYSACHIMLLLGEDVAEESANNSGSYSHVAATTALPVTSDMPIPPEALEEMGLLDTFGAESDPTQYTADELLQMQADVEERCSDTQTTIGRFHCENICQYHYCCFDKSTDGCRDDPTSLCDVYDVCKVLMQPLSSSTENNEEQSKTPQMALISAEEEHAEMESYAPAQSVTAFHGSHAPAQSPIVVHDSYAPVQTVIVVHDSYAPVLSAVVVHDSYPPAQSSVVHETLKPSPTLHIPAHVPVPIPIAPNLSSPPNGFITAITSTSSVHVPPPRPPIRCVPDGDDEVNVEVFTDDWNDDRFDRCARWESKYNMTVTEYWDVYGTSHLT